MSLIFGIYTFPTTARPSNITNSHTPDPLLAASAAHRRTEVSKKPADGDARWHRR